MFTVQDAPGHVGRLATSVAAQPAPVLSNLTLCGPGVTSPCADGTPARDCGINDVVFDEIHGKLTIPIYQQGTAPYETPAQGGGIMETAGVPAVVRTEEVCFALTVPKRSDMPAAGWPLVVYHHGTGGSMRSFISEGLASSMAANTSPAVVLGFDAVEHGARKGASTKKSDDLVFNPLNPRAARDNFLQGAVDVLQALRVAGTSIPAASSPTGAAIAFDSGAGRVLRALAGEHVGRAGAGVDGRRPGGGVFGRGIAPDVVAARQDDAGEHRRGHDVPHRREARRRAPGDDAVPELLRPIGSAQREPAHRHAPAGGRCVETRLHVVGQGRHVHAQSRRWRRTRSRWGWRPRAP